MAVVMEDFISGDVRYVFESLGGGFPNKIFFNDDKSLIVDTEKPCFSCMLGDGRKVSPFLPEKFLVYKSDSDDVHRIEFRKIPWRDEESNIIPDFYLSLSYEFWRDGTAFVNSFFFVENTQCPDIKDFIFEIPLKLSHYDDIRWGVIRRPDKFDATMIQSASPERFIQSGNNRKIDGHILPSINFNCYRNRGVSSYLEFLVEGQNSISGNPSHTRSEIIWNNLNPILRWNFQTEHISCHERPFQWRNQFGWIISESPKCRHFPPLRLYQYFDNYSHYPTNRQIEKMSAIGTDVLVLHENWRLDVQDGGIPYDSNELARVVKCAHNNKIRVALYIRGNENSVTEGACQWFDSLLIKNYDGLYMDYGGPFHEVSLPDENYHLGRLHFRKHYLKLRQLRQRVGENGLIFSHTGPLFSALGFSGNIVDTYLSGEGEKGVMLQSRKHHQYFSEAFASIGSMWTAAFPEYGTAKMIPYMASTGQFPHVPLGVQMVTSSLAHPNEPGINDVHLRPLWKLWGVFKNERNIVIYNDYNCCDTIFNQNDETGTYIMVSNDRNSALVILSNSAACPQCLKTKISLAKTGLASIENLKAWQFVPNVESPGSPVPVKTQETFTVNVGSYGVAGFLLTAEPEKWNDLFEEYSRGYPGHDETDKAYLHYISNQRELRKACAPCKEIYLQIGFLRDPLPAPYEKSLWWDLFDNAMNLVLFTPGKELKSLGWITIDGLIQDTPVKEKYIWPGHKSPWIALHEILPLGRHHLGICSLHAGEPFYSFIAATLAQCPDANSPEAYTLEFANEVEPDRAYLTFDIEITNSK